MLKTDAERERFIAEFWRRRDPDPRTDKNEYREEYYGRLAYANEHFPFGEVPGWRTDRGRTFLMFGRPDEVQRSAGGEVWLYKFVPALGSGVRFEFVDQAGTGDYRLEQRRP